MAASGSETGKTPAMEATNSNAPVSWADITDDEDEGPPPKILLSAIVKKNLPPAVQRAPPVNAPLTTPEPPVKNTGEGHLGSSIPNSGTEVKIAPRPKQHTKAAPEIPPDLPTKTPPSPPPTENMRRFCNLMNNANRDTRARVIKQQSEMMTEFDSAWNAFRQTEIDPSGRCEYPLVKYNLNAKGVSGFKVEHMLYGWGGEGLNAIRGLGVTPFLEQVAGQTAPFRLQPLKRGGTVHLMVTWPNGAPAGYGPAPGVPAGNSGGNPPPGRRRSRGGRGRSRRRKSDNPPAARPAPERELSRPSKPPEIPRGISNPLTKKKPGRFDDVKVTDEFSAYM
jgi:hypothetical protein